MVPPCIIQRDKHGNYTNTKTAKAILYNNIVKRFNVKITFLK